MYRVIEEDRDGLFTHVRIAEDVTIRGKTFRIEVSGYAKRVAGEEEIEKVGKEVALLRAVQRLREQRALLKEKVRKEAKAQSKKN